MLSTNIVICKLQTRPITPFSIKIQVKPSCIQTTLLREGHFLSGMLSIQSEKCETHFPTNIFRVVLFFLLSQPL